ncbi:MAG: J domain-containing protein [Candidatus Poribacteria bacterium]|nr:J domain-containing protein [Candidatus Poribacteria bacterium]
MTTTGMINPFDVLGVDGAASEADVKKAYFQMVRKFTPEKHGEQFKQIREAYDLLKDPSLRLEAVVFSFMTLSSDTAIQDVELPPIELSAKVLLSWMRKTFTDLDCTDFTGDFNEIL